MIWSLLIEGLLVLLLTATIYFAIRLNKRLTVLRVEKEQLEKLISLGEKKLSFVNIDPINKGPYILETLNPSFSSVFITLGRWNRLKN